MHLEHAAEVAQSCSRSSISFSSFGGRARFSSREHRRGADRGFASARAAGLKRGGMPPVMPPKIRAATACTSIARTIQSWRARHGEMQWVSRVNARAHEQRFFLEAQPIVPIGAAGGRTHYEVLCACSMNTTAAFRPCLHARGRTLQPREPG